MTDARHYLIAAEQLERVRVALGIIVDALSPEMSDAEFWEGHDLEPRPIAAINQARQGLAIIDAVREGAGASPIQEIAALTAERDAAIIRVAALQSVVAAAKKMPEPVAEYEHDLRMCPYCNGNSWGPAGPIQGNPIRHAPDCPWLALQAALAAARTEVAE